MEKYIHSTYQMDRKIHRILLFWAIAIVVVGIAFAVFAWSDTIMGFGMTLSLTFPYFLFLSVQGMRKGDLAYTGAVRQFEDQVELFYPDEMTNVQNKVSGFTNELKVATGILVSDFVITLLTMFDAIPNLIGGFGVAILLQAAVVVLRSAILRFQYETYLNRLEYYGNLEQ